jgi:hypothetical protein
VDLFSSLESGLVSCLLPPRHASLIRQSPNSSTVHYRNTLLQTATGDELMVPQSRR